MKLKIEFVDPMITKEQIEKWGDWRPKYASKFYIGKKKIEVPDYIYAELQMNNMVIVLISPRSAAKTFNLNRNIWSYNENGEKEWEIEARCKSIGKNEFIDPYTGFYKEEKKIIVTTFDGFYGELDIDTGKVKDWKWSR